METNTCPSCDSSDIHYEGQFDGAIPEFMGDTISALMLDQCEQMWIKASCNNCQAPLIPTRTGLRIST